MYTEPAECLARRPSIPRSCRRPRSRRVGRSGRAPIIWRTAPCRSTRRRRSPRTIRRRPRGIRRPNSRRRGIRQGHAPLLQEEALVGRRRALKNAVWPAARLDPTDRVRLPSSTNNRSRLDAVVGATAARRLRWTSRRRACRDRRRRRFGREAAAVRVERQPRLTPDDHSRAVATGTACGVAALARRPRHHAGNSPQGDDGGVHRLVEVA